MVQSGVFWVQAIAGFLKQKLVIALSLTFVSYQVLIHLTHLQFNMKLGPNHHPNKLSILHTNCQLCCCTKQWRLICLLWCHLCWMTYTIVLLPSTGLAVECINLFFFIFLCKSPAWFTELTLVFCLWWTHRQTMCHWMFYYRSRFLDLLVNKISSQQWDNTSVSTFAIFLVCQLDTYRYKELIGAAAVAWAWFCGLLESK